MVEAFHGSVRQRVERPPLITGKDLLDLGLEPGPEIGRLLEQLRQAQDDGEAQDKESALSLVREWMDRHGPPTAARLPAHRGKQEEGER
jgi:hypothetical protein